MMVFEAVKENVLNCGKKAHITFKPASSLLLGKVLKTFFFFSKDFYKRTDV